MYTSSDVSRSVGMLRYPGMRFDMRPMSVRPWMLEWPRSAFMPPPRTPMLPRMSCNMAIARMFCEPLECCVQPRAYIEVIVRVLDEHSPIISQTLRNLSFGVPQMRSTISGV